MTDNSEGHLEYLRTLQNSVQNQIVEICHAVLRGDVGILLGARQLRNLHYQLFDQVDDDFVLFIGIESETDHLPIGDDRQYWDKKVLIQKDKEIAEYEDRVRKEVFTACHKLIERFSSQKGLQSGS